MKYINIFLLFFFSSSIAVSQSSFYNEIGKNRIQYESFRWKVIYTNNFEIYFNNNSDKIAEIASDHLEKNFLSLTSYVGHQPFKKTKVFIFNSEKDLNQSNIGINETDEFLNTNLNFNNKIQFKIAFNNNLNVFKKNLDYEFSRVLIGDLMKGNMSFSKRFGKVSFTSIPNWFTDGAAKYLAYDWDIEMDNIIRDYFLTQNRKKIKKITEDQSGYIGQSIWNYISITYGKNTISNIINLAKIIRNPEKAISSSLGLSFDELIMNWSDYYYDKIKNNFIREDNLSSRISTINKKFNKIIDLKTNPVNNKIILTVNHNNYKKIVLYNIELEKFKTIDRLKNKDFSESFFISWLDNENISYTKPIKGENNIVRYNIENKNKIYKSINKFDKIHGFSYNSNQSLIVISGSINNQKDIYLLSANTSNMKKLTDDLYDDIYPQFFPNSTSIVFSSNRTNPSLNQTTHTEIEEYYNLFVYNLDTTKNSLHQITKTISNDIKPMSLSKNKLVYLSDLKGIYNLYSYSTTDGYKQISNFKSNIINYDFNKSSNSLLYNSLFEGEIIVNRIENFDVNKSTFGPQTSRIDYYQRKKTIEKRKNVEIVKQKKNNVDFKSTDDFEFEDEEYIKSSIQKNIEKYKKENTLRAPNEYKYSFIKNNFNSFVKIDPIEGYGTQVETDFIELFEDHKLYAKSFLPFSSLKSSDIYTEYSYLRHRFDIKLSLNRNILYAEDSENYIYHKYSLNQININFSYPISNFSRIEVSPFMSISKFYDLDYRVLNNTPPPFLFYEKTNYLGYLLNFMFDNSKKVGMNLEIGTKLKVSFKNYNSKINQKRNFNNFSIDLIHHEPIIDNIILSSRLFYGHSFGNTPYKYILGGVKNSLISSTEDKGINDPLLVANGLNNINFLFGEYINLRGYNFNKFDGFKALVLNTEIRIPLTRTMLGRSVTSNFLNNLQLIAFFDLGSSWNVNSPFSSKNDVNTWLIKEPGSVFQAEIENSKNPWLASYGFGIRSFVMDYFVKLDIAKPIEDYQVGNTKYHLSIGYSF